MTAPKMSPQTRAEIVRQLNDGIPVYRVAREVGVWVDSVRAIRDEEGVPKLRGGNQRLARPEPVRFDDPEEVDGAPAQADPHRIPVGLWCAERPNQARWMELVTTAEGVGLQALRVAMTWVLGLPHTATDDQIGEALTAERRTADELASLYLAALEGQ